jgi:hypothetical protein
MRGFGLHTYFKAGGLKRKTNLNQYGGGGFVGIQ